MLRLTIKSKRFLERWAYVLAKLYTNWNKYFNVYRTKQEAVREIAENIEEIGPQLREYSSSKDNYNEFLILPLVKKLQLQQQHNLI